MAALKEEVKMFIVQSLACYDTPSQVADSVYEAFDVKVDRSHIQRYDPTKVAGKDLSTKLKAIFDATRQAFIDETVQIPIASMTYRLRSLQRMHDYYVQKRNMVQAQSVLEQAAKEVAKYWSNKHVLVDNSDSPLLAFYKQISGTSIPVVQDDEIFEGEVVSFDMKPETENAAAVAKPKKLTKLMDRD